MAVLVAVSAWSIQAQAPANDFDRWWTPQNEALVAAPQYHTLLFENDEVRVLTVTIAPGPRSRSTRIATRVSSTTRIHPISSST
jgi:hypothetical protein